MVADANRHGYSKGVLSNVDRKGWNKGGDIPMFSCCCAETVKLFGLVFSAVERGYL